MISYYLPKIRSVSREQVHAAGLAHVFPDGVSLAQVHAAGPDGGDGCVVGSEPRGLGYFADRQTWTEAPGDRAWWIGVSGDTPPETLARKEQIAGHEVELGDGSRWLVPVARSFAIGSQLPEALVLGPDGGVVREQLEEFAKIGQRAERLTRIRYGWTTSEESPDIDDDEAYAIATEALAINYRIGLVEATVLRLYTDRTVARVMRALIDAEASDEVLNARLEAAKKKGPASTPDGSSSLDGAED